MPRLRLDDLANLLSQQSLTIRPPSLLSRDSIEGNCQTLDQFFASFEFAQLRFWVVLVFRQLALRLQYQLGFQLSPFSHLVPKLWNHARKASDLASEDASRNDEFPLSCVARLRFRDTEEADVVQKEGQIIQVEL